MSRIISKSDVKKHNRIRDLWFIIHNDVYDVTKFVSEHPGGEDTLMDNGGKDATGPFEDVGHSADARELLKKYKIGTLPPEEQDTGNAEGCPPRPRPAEKPVKCEADSRSRSPKKHSCSNIPESRGSSRIETSQYVSRAISVPLDTPRSSKTSTRRPRKCKVCGVRPCTCEPDESPQPVVSKHHCEHPFHHLMKKKLAPKIEYRENEPSSCCQDPESVKVTEQPEHHYESIYVPLILRKDQICSQCTSIESCPRHPKPEVPREKPVNCEADSRCKKKHSPPSPWESRGPSRVAHLQQRSDHSQLAITDQTSSHVESIYVPLEPSNWKWILLAALLSAVVIGVVLKRRG